jgi:hypothetical protein
MNIETFFEHYQVQQNPFAAEEARLDPLFDRLAKTRLRHPDFDKILGRIDQPATAVVFGEKGSGKTAIRLMVERAVDDHNEQHRDKRVLVVPYDDLNPVLDQLLRARKQDTAAMLEHLRLEDHQDALLSRAVTRLVDSVLDQSAPGDSTNVTADDVRRLRKGPKGQRMDFAVLQALYDQPRSGLVVERADQLRSKLGLRWRLPVWLTLWVGLTLALTAVVLWLIWHFNTVDDPFWLMPAAVVVSLLAAAALGYWAWRTLSLWSLSRKVAKEMPAMPRQPGRLRRILADLGTAATSGRPLPTPHKKDQDLSDARYQLTRQFVGVLEKLGFTGMTVLVDRVDEPTVVQGEPEKMRRIVWPMFDNKFLKQDGVGIKLLLPVELRYMLARETPQFFQEARLDKQNMIDRLAWTGSTLYDLCTARLNACRPSDIEPMSLSDMFEDDVTNATLVDALEQMHQPRDAFKFLYQTIQEHCRLSPEDQPNFKIARLTLDTIRKAQSQRVQEFYRGLAPA